MEEHMLFVCNNKLINYYLAFTVVLIRLIFAGPNRRRGWRVRDTRRRGSVCV